MYLERRTAASDASAAALHASLNASQTEAVETVTGPLLIIAGAGSGKTRVLTFRIAHLIRHGVAPWNILALTFTNKAAGEIKERLLHICGEQAARNIWAGTFHSVISRLLRTHAELLGYTQSFSIYDTDESLSVIRSAMNSMSISNQLVTPNAVRSAISAAKNQLIGWEEYARNVQDLRERSIAKVHEAYERQLRSNNAMDFDDLLVNMIRVLKSSPEMLQSIQSRFTHICVDEYQDTNRAQYAAVKLLADAHHNLCVVGDDAQSIYRWRGADIRNILDFQKDYPEAKVVRLEQNYRSTKNILAAADAVIRNNRNQLPKELWTDNEEGNKIHVYSNRDDRDEADRVAGAIDLECSGYQTQYKDVAVLYRTNAQSQALEDALRRKGIPYTIISGISFYKRKEVKDVAAYLRLLINPRDSESLLRIVNEPARGIGDTSMQRLRSHAEDRGLSLLEAFLEADRIEALTKRAQRSAKEFATLVTTFAAYVGVKAPDELAKEYIEATGILRMYQSQHTDEAEDRAGNIERLLTDIYEYTLREEEPSLEAYLQQLALVSDVDEADTSQNRVSVMTLHAAKGLEYPAVIITGVEEGLLPLVKDTSHPDEREEERRLFYVGITRACKRLYLTYSERRLRFGTVEYTRPSSFLYEMPAAVLHWPGRKENVAERTRFDLPQTSQGSYHRAPARPAPAPRPPAPAFSDIPSSESYSQMEPEAAAVPLKRGMKVRHKLFGDGTIELVIGVGDQQKVSVVFSSVGRKSLMVKFAKLDVI
ncbi:MAG: ATP-dependent helicase [Candidatus Kapaibacterium sp.]